MNNIHRVTYIVKNAKEVYKNIPITYQNVDSVLIYNSPVEQIKNRFFEIAAIKHFNYFINSKDNPFTYQITTNKMTVNKKRGSLVGAVYIANIEEMNDENTPKNTDTSFKISDNSLIRYKGTSNYVVVPNGVKKICSRAFRNSTIEMIAIPDSVTQIDNRAFEMCKNLKSISIPKYVNKINGLTFFYCKNLRSVVLPDELERICYGSFSNCRNLTYINIPHSLTAIEILAFENCNYLKNLSFPTHTKVAIQALS